MLSFLKLISVCLPLTMEARSALGRLVRGAGGGVVQRRLALHRRAACRTPGAVVRSQQVIYQMGTKLMEACPSIAEVHLEANNRTWDTIAERGDELGIYTDARPPYGCLGLRLKR